MLKMYTVTDSLYKFGGVIMHYEITVLSPVAMGNVQVLYVKVVPHHRQLNMQTCNTSYV